MHSGLLSNSVKSTFAVKTLKEKDSSGDVIEVEFKCKTSASMDECEDAKGLGITSGTKKYMNGGFIFTDPI